MADVPLPLRRSSPPFRPPPRSHACARAPLPLLAQPTPVFGGLLGVQKGREVEIVTSYELAYRKPQEGEMEVEESSTAAGGATDEVDWAFFEERTASCTSSLFNL